MPSLLPLNNDPLGRKNAAHLLRRATFAVGKQEIDTFSGYTITQALDVLFAPAELPEPPIDPVTGAPWVNPKRNDGNSEEKDLIPFTLSWWTDKMMNSGTSARWRFTWYLHTHFPTIRSRIPHSTAIYHQLMLFWHYSLGNIKTLSKKLCYDNAMLRHLDGRLNDKDRPNENFAREFFELFTVGKGQQTGPDDYSTFTEDDVKEASRVLSGFGLDNDYINYDPETGVAMGILKGNDLLATRHDAGTKTFSEAFNNTVIAPEEIISNSATKEATMQELDDFIEMVFAQKSTALFICRKLYRFYAYYNITDSIEQDIISPLADYLLESDYEIEPVLRRLLSSLHFYDADNATETDDIIGAQIKSPLEIIAGSINFFKTPLADQNTDIEKFYQIHSNFRQKMDLQGLEFFEPYDVSGYDAYHQVPAYNRNWITPNNLARRYQFAQDLVLGTVIGGDTLLYKMDIVAYVDNPANISDPEDAEVLAREIIENLLPRSITPERFDHFFRDILLDTLSVINWRFEWQNYKNTGDDSNVRVQLENFMLALMQSPEYQLM